MQETECQTIPPPPPPPPSQILPKNITPSVKKERTPNTQVDHLFRDSEAAIVSFYKPLCPIMQEGPSCGIAALCMASQFFSERTLIFDEVLNKAKTLDFSKQGEMFSVYNMAGLAVSVMRCNAEVVSDLAINQKDILHNICRGFPVLIPYDADKNHSPCLKNGISSHWAVLCGVCFSLPKGVLPPLGENFTSCEIPMFYRASNGMHAESLLDCAVKVCVYAYHGKSRHIALWDFETLLASTENLNEVTKKYPAENMVLPELDPLSELRDKALLLIGSQ